jgi:hypothetical protein
MKELNLEQMAIVEGGWAGECFFAIPLLFTSNPATAAVTATNITRVIACWYS